MKKKQQNERRLGAKAEGAEVKAEEQPAPSEAMIKHLRMVLSLMPFGYSRQDGDVDRPGEVCGVDHPGPLGDRLS